MTQTNEGRPWQAAPLRSARHEPTGHTPSSTVDQAAQYASAAALNARMADRYTGDERLWLLHRAGVCAARARRLAEPALGVRP